MKRNSLTCAMLILLLVAIVITPVISTAAMKMYVNIYGIPGESIDDKHKDWIDAVGYGDSILAPFSFSGGIQKPEFAPIKIIMFLDKASPLLRQAIAVGSHIQTVTIEFWDEGSTPKIIFKVELQDAVVGEVSTTWVSGSSDRPQKVVAVYFSRIRWTYTAYKLDGTPASSIVKGWDLLGNKPF